MEFSQLELIDEKLFLFEKAVYGNFVSIPNWKMRRATYVCPVEYKDYTPWENISVGDSWKCRFDEAVWFESEVTVPKEFDGKRVVLELSLGGEGLVSVNGVKKSSLAFYHDPVMGNAEPRERVDLTDCAKAGETYRISVQANMNYKDFFKAGRYEKYTDASTTEYKLRFAKLCVVNQEAEDYYFDMKYTLDLIKLLNTPAPKVLSKVLASRLFPVYNKELLLASRDDALCTGLIQALLRSLAGISFFGDREETLKNAGKARKLLLSETKKVVREKEGTVYVSGFAHMDIVWLWQEKHTVRKIANTFLNAIALSERYPDFVFTFTQPYCYSLLEEYYPDVFQKVCEKIQSGNIDPVGNLWVEMDTNLASGEAIVRQLLYGRKYYLEKFGKCSDIFFMPDSFGYSASLPQIMKRSGINYFLTNKLSMNEAYRFPYTFFRWQGIDGSQVASYLQQGVYNGRVNPERMEASYRCIENKNVSDTVYATFGYGDGGGGADYKMLEGYKRMKYLPGVPKVKMATFGEFFRKVTKNLDEFPVWNDELYLDRHRGTYTTHADIKKNNRRAELMLRQLEMAASWREILCKKAYPGKQIEALWKRMLHLQFHDSLPGSSIPQVYEDANREYALFFKESEALFAELLRDLSACVKHGDKTPVYWNFLSWNRKSTDKKAPEQLPEMGWSVAKKREYAPLSATEKVLENQFFKLTLSADGCISSMYDKKADREVFAGKSNVLEVFEEIAKPRLSAWDIHLEAEDTRKELTTLSSLKVLPADKNSVGVRITRKYGKSTIVQDVVLYDNLPRVDVKTHVDWKENMRMLKAAFYPAVVTSRASYEIQFGTIERPTHRNTEYDLMRFEACAHKWADLSQKDYGVSILNDCKYGYDAHGTKLRITLLRSPMEPDCTADRTAHDFVYSIFPHETDVLRETVRAGYELNVPAVSSVSASAAATLESAGSFVKLSAGTVVLDTFKKAEDGDGYIIRLYESTGASAKVTLEFLRDLENVTECDLMEQNERKLQAKGNAFRFEITPFCIKSYRIKFKE